MDARILDLPFRPDTLNGLSEKLIRSHHQNNYGGAVWTQVHENYQAAVEQASQAFGAAADDLGDSLLVDVRRQAIFTQSDALIEGATWQDPGAVATWAHELPRDREVVVYCVYGHEAGRSTAMRLRAIGLRARFLRGGFDGWRAAGRALAPKS